MKNKIIPIREQIADAIRSDIISGEIELNTKLNEQQLAERFGVSRGPIRDVLLKLTKEGLLVSKNNVGSSVNGPLAPELQKLNIEIRRKIEEFAVKQNNGNLSGEDISALEEIMSRMQEHFDKGEDTELTKVEIEFHQYYVKLAGGEDLLNTWYPIIMRSRMSYQRTESAQIILDEHKDILEAFKANDAKAAVAAIRKNIK